MKTIIHSLRRTALFLLAMLATASTAAAYDFEEGGIYYNISGSTATVTFNFNDINLEIVNDKMQWAIEGQHEFLIGASSTDIRLTHQLKGRQ